MKSKFLHLIATIAFGLASFQSAFAGVFEELEGYLDRHEIPNALKLVKSEGNEYLIKVALRSIADKCEAEGLSGSCKELISHFVPLQDEISDLWLEYSDELFALVVDAFESSYPKLLSRQLAGLLTYPDLSLGKVKYLVSKIPNFDGQSAVNEYRKDTFVDYAEKFHKSNAVIAFLKSVSKIPETPIDQTPLSETEYQLRQLPEDLRELQGDSRFAHKSSSNLKFDRVETLEELCHFLNFDACKPLSREAIDREVDYWAKSEKISRSEGNRAAASQRQRHVVAPLRKVKELMKGPIEIYRARDLEIDGSIRNGHGGEVGLIEFGSDKAKVVYKSFGSSSPSSVADLFEFIQNVEALNQCAPHVVHFEPKIVVTETKSMDFQLGYLMEVVPGKTLGDIKAMSASEKGSFLEQFKTTVHRMNQCGYNLVDFHDHNVMWDGNHLTMIDLHPSGFRIKENYSYDAIYHVETWLAGKGTLSPGESSCL